MTEACQKVAYRSERKARRAARTVTDAAGDRFRAYRCPDCGKWHLSSTAAQHRPGDGQGLNRSSHRRREPARSLDELHRRARAIRARDLEE